MALRVRNTFFTIHNYCEEQLDKLSEYDCSYLSVGLEVCPKTGTPHIQGYIEFHNGTTWSAFNKNIGCKKGGIYANCADREGTPVEAAGYCMKGEEKKNKSWAEFFNEPSPGWRGFQTGKISCQGERVDLRDLINDVLQERTTPEMVCVERPMMYHQYGRTLNKASDIMLRKKWRTWKTECIWYHGGTGTGKSERIFEGYAPDTHYLWNNMETFQCNYRGQGIIVIDELRNEIPYQLMLKLTDKYPLVLPAKGKDPFPFLGKKILISSCKAPEEIYKANDENKDSIGQLLRRIEVVNTNCTEVVGVIMSPTSV